MIGEHGEKAVKNAKDSLSKGVEDEQEKSICGRYSEAEVIAQLKKIAMGPCRLQFARNNIQPLCNQILRLRKVMVPKDSEMPWRKRKLEQFFKYQPRTPGLVLLNQQNSTKVRRRQLSNTSSVSCVLNSFDTTQFRDEKTFFDSHTSSSLTFDDALPEKQASIQWLSQDDMVNWIDLTKYISPTVDTDESANGSDPSLENPTPNDAPCVEISDAIRHSNSLSNGAQKRQLQPPRQSIRLLNLIGDHLQTKVIPVGTRFQADVPKWSGTLNRSMLLAYKNNSDNSKWLGTLVWPIEVRNMKTTGKTIGKGRRPKSCSCACPGSVDCIKHHVSEKRLLLQRELGPAFFSWKFHEMGGHVSNSWSLKNQQAFESVVKMRPPSNGNDFLKRALKRFPKKNPKDLVNYYFNVYIPHRMSQQTALPSTAKQVDTDDEDEVGDFNYLGVKKRSGRKKLAISNSKYKKC